MISKKNNQEDKSRKNPNMLSLVGDALCIAVQTALRLVDESTTNPDCEEKSNGTIARVVTTALRLVDQESSDTNPESLPEISLDQVSWHDNISDCWIVVYDHVYDITQFLFEHPGGEEILLEYAGLDASFAFRGVGHTESALRSLETYKVGILPENERIFKNKTGSLSVTQPNITVNAISS